MTQRPENDSPGMLPPPIPLPDDADGQWTKTFLSELTSAEMASISQPATKVHQDATVTGASSSTGWGELEIPGYTLHQRLGQGGMGTVYLAVDRQLGREVAIKVISEAANATPKMRERFDAEAKTVAQLQHPNIAQLHAAGEAAGRPYLVMEYVDGTTLDAKASSSGSSAREAAVLIRTLAQAMQYCHERHIIHRDLKPSNILIDAAGTPKIADFGIAKLLQQEQSATLTGEILGTPAYMPPEQASGLVKGLGPTTDVYSLGAILYKLLTGRPPFLGDTPMQTVMRVLSDDVVPPRLSHPQIPKDLETICLKCLEKRAVRRYATAQELTDELDRYLNNQPILARPTSRLERAGKWARRHPAQAVLMAAIAIAIPTIIGGLTWHSQRLQQQLTANRRLAERGSDLSIWLVNDHLRELRGLRGTTSVQFEVVQRVQDYLSSTLNDAEANPKLLRRLAVAYQSLGDILGNPNYPNLGQADQSMAHYQQASDLLERSLQLDRQDRPTRLLQIETLIKQSDVMLQRLGPQEAKAAVQQAQRLVDSLPGPDNDEVRLLRVQIEQRDYEFDVMENRFEDALAHLDRGETILNEFSSEPKWQTDLLHQRIIVEEGRGTTLEAMGDYELAKQHYEQAMRWAREAYQNSPDDPAAYLRYSTCLISLGDCLTFLEDFNEAHELFQTSLNVRQELAQADPENRSYQAQMATAHARLASAEELRGDLKSASNHSDKALKIRRELAELAPQNRDFKMALSIELLSRARIELQLGHFSLARETVAEQDEVLQPLLQDEQVDANVLNVAAQGRFHEGMASFQELLQELEVGIAFSRDLPRFVSAMQSFDASLALFARIESRGAMTAAQAAFRESVLQTKALVEDMATQLTLPPDAKAQI